MRKIEEEKKHLCGWDAGHWLLLEVDLYQMWVIIVYLTFIAARQSNVHAACSELKLKSVWKWLTWWVRVIA